MIFQENIERCVINEALMLESGASAYDDGGATLSAVTWITSVPTSEDAGGSKSFFFCF